MRILRSTLCLAALSGMAIYAQTPTYSDPSVYQQTSVEESERAFAAAARGYAVQGDAISDSLALFGARSGMGSEDAAVEDEFEPKYDPYLDDVPLKRFDLQSRAHLQASLGAAYRDGDTYAEEYVKKDPLTRFVELKYRDENHWVIDNYRNTRLVGRKGETGPNGQTYDKHTVEIDWTSAFIDVSKLKAVNWVMTTFNTKIGPLKMQTGHGQLYFEFEDGGVITPQGETNSLVNSYEGFRDAGTIFNPIKGMLNAYDSIFVMGSFSDVTLKALKVFNGVDIYRLNLTDAEAKRVLINSLALATDREELADRKYHTTRNSCVTNQVRLINSGLPEEKRIQEWHTIFGKRVFRTLGSILPSKIAGTLKDTGLMQAEAHYIGRDRILELYDMVADNKPVFEELSRQHLFGKLYQTK